MGQWNEKLVPVWRVYSIKGKNMVYKYCWLHLETKKIGEGDINLLTRMEFLELLSKWNRDPRWKYWEK